MSAWIGIIGTVIGAILGGGLALLNAHLQTRRQGQQERRKLILSKLEELHEAISYYRREHRENLLLVLTMPEGPNTENVQQPNERRDLSIDRIQMLVGFYAPELSTYLEKIMKETVSHMETVVTYGAAKRLGEPRDENITDSLWSTREELDSALTLMQLELENVARKYM